METYQTTPISEILARFDLIRSLIPGGRFTDDELTDLRVALETVIPMLLAFQERISVDRHPELHR